MEEGPDEKGVIGPWAAAIVEGSVVQGRKRGGEMCAVCSVGRQAACVCEGCEKVRQ